MSTFRHPADTVSLFTTLAGRSGLRSAASQRLSVHRSFAVAAGADDWNKLPSDVKSAPLPYKHFDLRFMFSHHDIVM
jgi:hypothetical protein